MAGKSRSTFQKNEKERARQRKQQEKEAKRQAVKDNKLNPDLDVKNNEAEAEDPDLAGIRPGPQRLPEQWDNVEE
jgi:hypothetical protein